MLRNETMLLLTRLVAGSADISKIAVFEGAFDRLLGIIRRAFGASVEERRAGGGGQTHPWLAAVRRCLLAWPAC